MEANSNDQFASEFFNCKDFDAEEENCLSRNNEWYSASTILPRSEQDEEQELAASIELMNRLYRGNSPDESLSFLCNYLKSNILADNQNEVILHKSLKEKSQDAHTPLGGRSLSIDNLKGLDLKSVVNSIVNSKKSIEKSDITTFLLENIEIKDEKIKIMLLGKQKTGKSLFVHHLKDGSTEEYEYNPDSMQYRLFT